VADLVGMVLGIELARLAGTQALYIWGAYIILSCLDFVFILKVRKRALYHPQKSPIYPQKSPILPLKEPRVTHERAPYRPYNMPRSPMREPYITR